MKTHDSGKLSNIQLLRAIAATLVIFVHLEPTLATMGLPAFGASGVDLFFVISGYIMVYTTYGRGVTGLDFLKNRIARIVPLYWLMTFLVFLVALIVPNLLQSTSADLVSLFKSLLFIPFERAPGDMSPIFFLGWTLNYEMFFYALFAFGLFFRSSPGGIFFTISVLLALSVTGSTWPASNPLVQFYTAPIMLEFALGMLIALFFRKAWNFSHPAWRLVLTVLGLTGLAALTAPPLVSHVKLAVFISRGMPAAITVWSALALESRGDYVKKGFLVRLGDASYAMYLTHPFVAQVFQKIAIRLHTQGLVTLAVLILAVAAAAAVALWVHAKVEKPLTAMARRLLGVTPRRHAFHVA